MLVLFRGINYLYPLNEKTPLIGKSLGGGVNLPMSLKNWETQIHVVIKFMLSFSHLIN